MSIRTITLMGISILLAAGCGDLDLTPIPEPPSYLGVSLGNVAVVTGDFDRIEELLSALDIPYSLYDGFASGPPPDAALLDEYNQLPTVEQLLGDPDTLEFFDVLFLNCGIRGTGTIDPSSLDTQTGLLDNNSYLENLRDFVENGGALFVSDRSYTLLEAAFPSLIDFQGNDLLVDDALLGASGTLTALVVDPELRHAITSSIVDINFPESRWAMPLQSDGIWLTADALRLVGDEAMAFAPSTPLLIRQSVGYGTIIYTSFHNLPKVDQTLTDLQLYMLRALANENE